MDRSARRARAEATRGVCRELHLFPRAWSRRAGGPIYAGAPYYYGVELHNFNPNSIAQAAIVVAVCEGYLGIAPH